MGSLSGCSVFFNRNFAANLFLMFEEPSVRCSLQCNEPTFNIFNVLSLYAYLGEISLFCLSMAAIENQKQLNSVKSSENFRSWYTPILPFCHSAWLHLPTTKITQETPM